VSRKRHLLFQHNFGRRFFYLETW